MDEIHIGQEIKKVLDSRGITKSEFARRIHKTRENVYSIIKRQTIDTNLLLTISNTLNYNFFELFFADESKDEKIKSLTSEIKLLREMVDYLQKKNKK